MPELPENVRNEIRDGKNARKIMCQFCPSKILNPSSAKFCQFEFDLPLAEQRTNTSDPVETEKITSFWEVNNIFMFENVGVSNVVKNIKYLTCADCEVGPIGYYEMVSKKSFIAFSRVKYSS